MIILTDFEDHYVAINPEQIVYVQPKYINGIDGCQIQFTSNTVPAFFKNSFDSVVESLNVWRKKK